MPGHKKLVQGSCLNLFSHFPETVCEVKKSCKMAGRSNGGSLST